MRNWTKAALVGLSLTGALFAAGCAYDDGYYGHHRSYYGDRYDHGSYDNNAYRDRDDQSRRVRVCDSNGDDCHWEYQRQ